MIRRVVVCICCGVLLCGCAKASTPIDAQTIESYNQALETSLNLNNYSLSETCQIITTLGEGGNQNSTTETKVLIDKTEDKKEGYGYVLYTLEGVGSNEVEVWEKEKVVYLSNDGTRSVNDVETMDVLSNIANNVFFKIVTQAPLTSGMKRIEKDSMILEMTMDEDVIISLLETGTILPEDYTLKVKRNLSEVTIHKNSGITEIQVSVQVDIETNETVMDVQLELKSEMHSIGSTHVQFPDDLDSFDRSKVKQEDELETLKKTLVMEYDYIQTDEVYVYDWGTEKYVFDFGKNAFYLETELGNYEYNWILDNGSAIHSGCLYDFLSETQKNCSEEEIENIKLSKEVFEDELSYSGISRSSLN